MTIASEINRLQQAKNNIKTAIENKGVEVLSNTKIDDYASLINSIKTSVSDYLCFIANVAGSTIQLTKVGDPTNVSLEISSDLENWNDYIIGNTITFTNQGDKIYFRNKSDTQTGFSTSYSNYYQFVMSGSISGSGDINYLLCKYSTRINTGYTFCYLFKSCSSLTTAPEIPASSVGYGNYREMFNGCTNLVKGPSGIPALTMAGQCCVSMFQGCVNLTTLPKLFSTTLADYCYSSMFNGCSKIKLSSTKTGEYQTAYRIPIVGTGSGGSNPLDSMFNNTGGTFTGKPTINTTYYTSNDLV